MPYGRRSAGQRTKKVTWPPVCVRGHLGEFFLFWWWKSVFGNDFSKNKRRGKELLMFSCDQQVNAVLLPYGRRLYVEVKYHLVVDSLVVPNRPNFFPEFDNVINNKVLFVDFRLFVLLDSPWRMPPPVADDNVCTQKRPLCRLRKEKHS